MPTKDNPETKTSVSAIKTQMQELVALRDSFDEEQRKFIKGLLNPDLTDPEMYMFLNFANKAGLNPFAKEIIAVVYGANGPSRRVNTIVTRDGKRAVAYRKGGIESIVSEPIYIKTTSYGELKEERISRVAAWEGGKLWGATATVKRNNQTFTVTVPISEYNLNTGVWGTKPETMIKKVAESQALSMAVPELLGLYDESEMSVESGSVSVSAAPDDNEPAGETLKETVAAVLKANDVDIDISDLTKGRGKALLAEYGSKKKK